MNRLKTFSLLFFLQLICLHALGQDLRISASVNQNNITDKDVLIFSVTLEGISDFPEVPPPESPDFVLISGPSQSSSIQIINGKMSASKTVSWQIAPTRAGKLTINPISIKYRGKIYSTEPVIVNVTASAPTQPRSAPPSGTPDKQVTPSSGEEVFLKAVVPKTTIYMGEELIVSFDLYFKNVRTFGRKKLPDAQGFWKEELDAPTQPTITNETVNGVAYRKATIQQIALFATTTGELTIDPMVVDCEVIQPSQRRSIFDDFFGGSFFDDPMFSKTKIVTVQSEPIKIRVRPLPESGQPASFIGAVGQFKIESKIDTLQVKQDQALTLQYKISGSGNINAIKLPPPSLPNSVEVFEPKIEKKIDKSSGSIKGSVTYEYVLIPRRPGLLTVPAIWFSYFDPQTETYRTISTSSFKVKIVGSEDMLSDRSVGLSKTEVSLLGQDIRFIMRENPVWRKSGQTVFSEFWFWLINGFSVLVIIGAITLRWWTEKMESNLTFARRRQAWSKWQNRLRTLQKMADNVVGEDFYAQLSQAVNGYIADRLGLPLAGLGPKEIEQELRRYAIDSELITKTVKLLEKLDEIRFLPGMIIADDPKEMLSSSREIVSALSKVI